MKTIFCDIDGTLFKFREDFGSMMNYAEPLKGVVQTTMEWHKKGYKVILVTGRPEPFRKITEDQLRESGIIYDQLVMGAGSGPRYLINDKTPQGEQTAFSISIDRNEGLNTEILEEKKGE
tara:strand:+ start:45 stop:404 length:360 start_codon:yes stop_codon:yes gene_type:complete